MKSTNQPPADEQPRQAASQPGQPASAGQESCSLGPLSGSVDVMQQLWSDSPDLRVEQGLQPPSPASRLQLHLLIAPRRALRSVIAAAAARLCLNGPVRVIDGGDLYDAHSVARQARLLTPHLDDALERIRIARAFTCYQVEALLNAQQTAPQPLLALDLLSTFADENVPLAHRDHLARLLVRHLQRLSQQAVTLVGVAPAQDPPVSVYLSWLARSAGQVLRLEDPRPPPAVKLF